MPFWTREQLLDQLLILVEDVERAAGLCADFDYAIGGSEGLPPDEFGDWASIGRNLGGDVPGTATVADILRAQAQRLPRADDSDLGTLRGAGLYAHQLLHELLPRIEPWCREEGPGTATAHKLRRRLQLGEDQGLRVLTGAGDVRRNERRARQLG